MANQEAKNQEKKVQEYTTIMSSNISAITPAKYGGARSDGIFSQFNDERVKELPTDNNVLTLTNITFIPFLDEVSFTYKDNDYKAVYVKNPAKNRANELVAFYKKEDGKWQKVEDFDKEIQLQGMKKEAYRVGDISDVVIAMFNTIKDYKDYDFSDDFRDTLGVLVKMAVVKEDKIIPPVPDVENVETLTKALQDLWTKIPTDEIKKEFVKKLVGDSNKENEGEERRQKLNVDELRRILGNLEEGKFVLTADDISYVDENSLYKLTDNYVKNEKDDPLLEADRKMALRLKELNKSDLKNAKRKVLNYYLVGLSPEGNPVVIKNEAIRNNSFYNDAENIKKKSLEYYMDLMRNFEKFKKIVSKGDKDAFLQVLGAWNEMLNKSTKFIPKVNLEEGEELTTEEYKKLIEEIKTEMENNDTLKQEFLNEIENGLLLAEILKESDFVSNDVAKQFERELLTIKEKFGKEDVVELFAQYRKAQKAVTVALNAFKETIFAFKMNENVVPVDDKSSFPRMVSNTALITYNEISKLKYNSEDNVRNAVLAFSVKEVGKEGNSDIVPLLMPVAMYDGEKNVAKFDTRASNLAYTVEKLREVSKLAEAEKSSTVKVDDVYTTRLNRAKKEIVEYLEKIKEQKGSKIFILDTKDKDANKELVKEVFAGIKKASTFSDLIEAVKKISAFENVDKLPDLSAVLYTKLAEGDTVQNYLKNNVLTFSNEGNQYFPALHNTYLGEIIKNAKVGNVKQFKENNLFTTYVKYYIAKAIKGNTCYKKDGIKTFLPAPGLGDLKPEKIQQVLLSESNKINLSAEMKEQIKKDYGYKSKDEKFKETYNDIASIVNKKTKNPINEIVSKKIKKAEEKKEEELPEEIASKVKEAEKENVIPNTPKPASEKENTNVEEKETKSVAVTDEMDYIDPAEVSDDMGLFGVMDALPEDDFGNDDPFLNDIDESLFNNRFDENPFDKEGGAKARPKMG